MFVNFNFNDGSNSYITMTNKELFRMLCKYNYSQIGETNFCITGENEIQKKDYKTKQSLLRDIAIQWQNDFSKFAYSYGELSEWQGFFEEYGKKYGLLTEFRENAIC